MAAGSALTAAMGTGSSACPSVLTRETDILLFDQVDAISGRNDELTPFPLSAGDCAVVGLSWPHRDETFGGLALETELAKRSAEARFGLLIIDSRSGDVLRWLRVQGMVSKIDGVAVLPDVHRPMAPGFKSAEIQRIIAVGDEGGP